MIYKTSSSSWKPLGFSAIIAVIVWLVWFKLAGPFPFAYIQNHWEISLTMVFGSLIAGATSEGGGAVAFPVFTKLLHIFPQDSPRSDCIFPCYSKRWHDGSFHRDYLYGHPSRMASDSLCKLRRRTRHYAQFNPIGTPLTAPNYQNVVYRNGSQFCDYPIRTQSYSTTAL